MGRLIIIVISIKFVVYQFQTKHEQCSTRSHRTKI